MAELKRTQLYGAHVKAGAKMVDFGGWEMPIQYPTGIIAEHLYTRHACSIFDVSHMGRIEVRGPERIQFLQHVLTNNVQALELNKAQYSIVQSETGGAIDDAYVYCFEEDVLTVVVNAANTDTDWVHFSEHIKKFDAVMENVSKDWAAIAVQGPESKNILQRIAGGDVQLTEPMKNELNTLTIPSMDNMVMKIAKTGYTGEPIGYEIYIKSQYAEKMWDRLIEEGAKPAGLGARDTTRLEAGMPLHGHELGEDINGKEIPIYAVPLAKFAVSFSPQKGDFIGREALAKQQQAFIRINNRDFSDCEALPRRIMPITLLGRGVMRAGCPVLKDGKEIGYVTSGTMVPYYVSEGKGLSTVITDDIQKRSIGSCFIDSDVLTDSKVQIDIRGKLIDAVIPEFHMKNDAPPFTRVILYREEEAKEAPKTETARAAMSLISDALSNHVWRQEECINMIPSEMSASKAVRLLQVSDPCFRYAEHRKVASFYNEDIFYYQGTEFIGQVEELLMAEMAKFLGCKETETRVLSGQMSNTCVFSALVDFKNRLNRKVEAKRLGYVMNNHIIKGGHLSAQPMGALKDFIAVDPVTEKKAVVNFPVCTDDPYRIDVEETKKVIAEYKPELIIFGKSMVVYKEPVKEIADFIKAEGIDTTIMYDMAHVLGLIGDHFQKPFEEGADLVTGSTHKTFFGPQRGVIGGNWEKGDFKYELWETIQSRAFPGSTSNHHLGTQLALLMAAYEMNTFKDEYQKNIIANAKSFARSLADAGFKVEGDPSMGYTETHQVIVSVGYATGAQIAQRLEDNNLICNYQATPYEEGFTASGALRLGVSEMTRFGFGEKEFAKTAELMADCALRGKDVKEEVKKLRADFTEMKYCFNDADMERALADFAGRTGLK